MTKMLPEAWLDCNRGIHLEFGEWAIWRVSGASLPTRGLDRPNALFPGALVL